MFAKKGKGFVVLLLILCYIIVYFYAERKITYLEYSDIYEASQSSIQVNGIDGKLMQEFYPQYDLIKIIEIKTEKISIDNNIIWNVSIIRSSDKKQIASEHLYGSFAKENQYYQVEFSKPLKMDKNEKYELHLDCYNKTSFVTSFCTANSKEQAYGEFYVNGICQKGDVLAVRQYGCDRDNWWIGFFTICYCYIVIFILYSMFLLHDNKKILQDKLLQSAVLVIVVFAMLSIYAKSGTFIDESDNIRGGMIIAKGGVLYRDYVTQHMPFVYYLCSIFARIGAASIEQFRLCYAALIGMVWGFLYFRHCDFFGKKRIFLMPVVIYASITTMFTAGYQIMSDNIQGICMAALFLELMRYCKDHKLGWDRSIIVSVCIFGSFGSAFISAYPLLFVVLFVFMEEMIYWKTNFSKLQIKSVFFRYYKLAAACGVPFIVTLLYFWQHDALRRAYDMAYRFNREVYPHYLKGYGDHLEQPVLNGIKYYLEFISSGFHSFITEPEIVEILKLSILVCVGILLVLKLKKGEIRISILLFLFLCCNATRDYGFHSLPVFYTAIAMIIIFLPDMSFVCSSKARVAFTAVVCAYFLQPYVSNAFSLPYEKQECISELENYVVHMTKENEKIFIDTNTCDSIYLLYKDRYPVNRVTYFLPWYMDWYEQEAIFDMDENMPALVVYNPNTITYMDNGDAYEQYSSGFLYYLRQKYATNFNKGDMEWRQWIWEREIGKESGE